MAGAWGGNPPFSPCYVVTHASHTAPEEWLTEGSPFTFVTDGVESAVAQAKAAAGDKNVAIATASITRNSACKRDCWTRIHIDLAPSCSVTASGCLIT